MDALVALGLAASRGEARRKLAEGAVRVDDEPVREGYAVAVATGIPVKVSLGKKRHALLIR